MIKFTTNKHKPILFCIVDNLDKYQTGWAKEVSINLTDYMIHRLGKDDDYHRFDVYIGKDEDELLRAATEDGYSHAVIVASGTSLKLSDRLFAEVTQKCQEDFFIAGHVLDRTQNGYFKDACFELHHQFYIVNLAQYKELGFPIVGKEAKETYTQVTPLRSEEHQFNDREIPLWVKKGNEVKEYHMKLHGWNILNVGFENDKTIVDLGAGIRNTKQYLYYETDHVFLKMMADMYHYEFFGNVFTAGWNSDLLAETIRVDGPVEQYISVGTGLYWISNLEKIGFTSDTKVIFTDINYNCLMFMKSLVEEWDGKDYPSFYKQRIPVLPNGTPNFIDHYVSEIESNWLEFVSKFEDWDSLWNKVRQLKFEFIPLNYLATHDYSWIDPTKKTIMNLSDLYSHAPYVPTQSLKYRISCENKLINELTNLNSEIFLIVTSRAADGFWKDYSDVTYADKISNFKLTDISKLRIPLWHITEWTPTYRPLGT